MKNCCETLATLSAGNAHNRTTFGKTGACQLVKDLLFRYSQDIYVASSICRAIFYLASGDPQHKQALSGVRSAVQAIVNDRNIPDELKKEAKEALRYV